MRVSTFTGGAKRLVRAVLELPATWRGSLQLRVVSLTRHLQPDVVHTWLAHMDIIGGSAARLVRVPWVMSERSAELSYPRSAISTIRRTIGKSADLIVANSAGGFR